MNLHSGGDDNSHWSHLTGIVFDKTSDTLLIELNDTDESISFFDTSKVSLDCTKCKKDLEQISEGDVIKFYFFKYNIDNGTVKAESIVKTKSYNILSMIFYKYRRQMDIHYSACDI